MECLCLERLFRFDHAKLERVGAEWSVSIRRTPSTTEMFCWKGVVPGNVAPILHVKHSIVTCCRVAPEEDTAGDSIFSIPVDLERTVTTSPKIQCLHGLDKDKDVPVDAGPQQKTSRKGEIKLRKDPIQEGNEIAQKMMAAFRQNLPIAFNVQLLECASLLTSPLLNVLSQVLYSFRHGYLTYRDLRQQLMETLETATEHAVFKSAIRHLIICVGLCLREELNSEGKAVEYKHQLGALLKKQGLSNRTCLAALGGLSATDFRFRHLYKASKETATRALEMAALEMANTLKPYENRATLWVLNPGRFIYWLFNGRPPAFPKPRLWSMRWPPPGIVDIQHQLYPGTETTTGQYNAELDEMNILEMDLDISDEMARNRMFIGNGHGKQIDERDCSLATLQHLEAPTAFGAFNYGEQIPQQTVMVDHRFDLDSTFSCQHPDTAHPGALGQPEPAITEEGLFTGFYMDNVFPDTLIFSCPL
uniref:Uncharacterized protein n=1 Tax=Bionectria ochroleuca TaxID=29856 RepID=A0A8H7TM55_BIOOC